MRGTVKRYWLAAVGLLAMLLLLGAVACGGSEDTPTTKAAPVTATTQEAAKAVEPAEAEPKAEAEA